MSDVTVDASAVSDAVRRWALEAWQTVADVFVTTAQGNASRRTGALAESISHDEPRDYGTGVTCTATCGAEYGQYQDEGTGIYGPDGAPIYPTHSKVLVFDWPAAGGIVFARWVRGSEPTRFWQRTIEAWPEILAVAS